MSDPSPPVPLGARGSEAVWGWTALALLGAVLAFVPNARLPLGIDGTFLALAGLAGITVLPFADWRTAAARWWPYGVFLAYVGGRAAVVGASPAWMEAARVAAFVTVVLSVGLMARTEGARRLVMVAMLVVIGVLLPQVLGPGLGAAGYGRMLFYLALEQWGGYPELGMLACVGLGLAAGLLLTRATAWWVRGAAGLLILVYVGSAAYVFSRSALVAALLTGAWLVIVRFDRKSVRLAALVGAAGAVVVMVGGWFGLTAHTAVVDVAVRAEGWRTAVRMVAAHPMTGVGPGMYMTRYPEFSAAADPTHAYNLVLHEAAELGMVGLVLYLALWARVLATSWPSAAAMERAPTVLAVHGAIVAFFLRSMSEHFLANLGSSFRMLLLLALLFGLAEGLVRNTTNAAGPESTTRLRGAGLRGRRQPVAALR